VYNAAAELKQRLARVPVAFVLFDGVFNRLLGQTVLHLERHHRQAVDEGAQVQGSLCLLPTVRKLASDTKAILSRLG